MARNRETAVARARIPMDARPIEIHTDDWLEPIDADFAAIVIPEERKGFVQALLRVCNATGHPVAEFPFETSEIAMDQAIGILGIPRAKWVSCALGVGDDGSVPPPDFG